MIENHFLDLVHLRRCDAETIFSEVETYLRDNDLDLKKIKFAGMDGYSTMAGWMVVPPWQEIIAV